MGMRQYQIPRNKKALCNNKDFWKFGNPVCEPANEHWEWAPNTDEPPAGYIECPADLVDALNRYGAPKPILQNQSPTTNVWTLAPVVGKESVYEIEEMPALPADTTEITFNFRRRGQETPLFQAIASRSSATDTNPVPVNGSPRPAGK